jgi:26S proteasome regulatory subunit N12
MHRFHFLIILPHPPPTVPIHTQQVELTKFPALPPTYQFSPNAQEQLSLARSTLELAIFLAVRCSDDAAFERNFNQLRPYYLEARSLLPPSDKEGTITSAALLRLLAQNRIAEFHTSLEILPPQLTVDPQVAQVTELERLLMEGRYPRVLSTAQAGAAASELHAPFLTSLVATVRDEVASCCERAYTDLPAGDAVSLLGLQGGMAELRTIAEERVWQIVGDKVVFNNGNDGTAMDGSGITAIPSLQMIHNCFIYAKELERIV